MGQQDVFGILLEFGPFNRLKLTCLAGAKPISPFSGVIPSGFRSLARRTLSYGDVESDLISYLENHLGECPIYLRQGRELVEFVWNSSLSLTAKTRLSLIGTDVVADRVAVQGNKIYDDCVLIGDSLVADKKSKRVGSLKDRGGWELWNQVRNVKKKSEYDRNVKKGYRDDLGELYYVRSEFMFHGISAPIELTVAEFNKFQIAAAGPGDANNYEGMIFEVDGQAVKPVPTDLDYSVLMNLQSDAPYVDLRVESRLKGNTVFPTIQIFEYFVSQSNYPSALTSTESKTALMEGLRKLAFIDDDSEADQVIDDLVERFPKKSSHMKTMVETFLSGFYETMQSPPLRLLAMNGSWIVVQSDLKTEVASYVIPLEVLGDELTQGTSSYSMSVSSSKLAGTFDELEVRFKENSYLERKFSLKENINFIH